MIFDCNDFNCLNIYKENKRVIFTTNFIKPVHIVMASIIQNYMKYDVIFENNQTYAENMLYKNPLEIDTIDGKNHTKAIKLKSHFDNDKQVEKVLTIIKENSFLDKNTVETLNTIISEIFQNFYNHADTVTPPICCVQNWPSSQFLEIAIADNGIGIPKSLKNILKNYPEETNPCELACQNGITSKLGQNHSGYGLYFTKRFIEENKGKFFLYSDKYCYKINDDNPLIKNANLVWPGTVIRLIINKNKSINRQNFFRMITLEQGGDNDFF